MTSHLPSVQHRLARQVRVRFVEALDAVVTELGERIQRQFSSQLEEGRFATPLQAQKAQEAQAAFQRERGNWLQQVRQGCQKALAQTGASGMRTDMGMLELVDDEVVERKIIASRLAAAIGETAGAELNDLRLRMQALEGSDLPGKDVLLPETLAQLLLQAWADAGLGRDMWAPVHAEAAKTLSLRMGELYRRLNETLAAQGVSQLDMRKRVRRDGGPASGPGPAVAGGDSSYPASLPGAPGSGPGPYAPTGYAASAYAGAAHASAPASAGMYTDTRHGGLHTQTPYVRASALAQAEQETRMLTGLSPVARIRQRAQGVLGQLRRLVSHRVSHFGEADALSTPSPGLAAELAAHPTVQPFPATEWIDRPAAAPGEHVVVPSPAQVQAVAQHLRQNAADLKAKADKPNEKATIEIVALMFQAILAEERIPATIRVWFARLQIPVLRLALAEPDFFASVQHPARQLIDRMGACVMGFDAAQVAGSRLEREIKRIVQVIEQYPETGRRVYQLVLGEFKKFLGRSLTETDDVQNAVTLAQQVEQKEALTIQYTIELRRMLANVAVPDDVREFLFRIWSEVLALAAVRHGAHDKQTLRYKQAAADLLWVVSPKTDRAERARVVQKLPCLLQTLRQGMEMLVMIPDEQDGHIKLINDAVKQAFTSRGEGMPQELLDELAQALAGLEDEVTDDPEGDMLLDPGMIELMFGIGSDMMEVIAQGGSQPGEGMLQWARELELGSWFQLDYQGTVAAVQYVWRSARGQLHLFAAGPQRSYLVQTRRLAAYLQAGLLTPAEDESLTVRATRQALAKLNADPDQLLR